MASKNGVTIIIAGEDKTGEVFNAVQAHLEQTSKTTEETEKSFRESMAGMQESITLFRDAFVLDRVYDAMKEMVGSTIEAAEQISHLNQQTGISTQNLSVLKYVAASTGVAFESLTKGFKNISTEVRLAEEGNPGAVQAFSDLGISVADLRAKGDDMLGVFRLVAEKFRDLPAGIDKNALATEIFKKSGQDLIPVLNDLDTALEEGKQHAAIFSDDDIKKTEGMHKAIVDLSASWQKFELQTVSASAPLFEGSLKFITDMGTALKSIGQDAVDDTKLFANLAARSQGIYLGPLFPKASPPPASSAPEAAPHESRIKLTPEEIAKESAARMEADRTALAQQKSQHDMSIAEEIEFWQKRIGAFQRGSAQYLEALNEINRLTKELATKAAEAQKQTLNAFISQSIEDARNKQEENQRIHDAIADSWQSDLKSQEDNAEAANATAQATATANAKIADAAVQHELISKAITKEAAAQQEAAIRVQEYADKIAALTALQERLNQVESEGGEVTKRPNEIQDQITGMRGDAAAASVVASPIEQNSNLEGEAEKFAHGVFDPLFNLGEKWDKQWKQIRANMLKDIGQEAESKLFGALFGDPSGRGGKGWNGSSFKGDTSAPGAGGGFKHNGLIGEGIAGVEALFGKKKSGPTSNGGYGSGAGTIPSVAASSLGIGKSASAGGGITVNITNTGTPQDVTQTQQQSSGPDLESHVINIFTKDLSTNGPIAQGIMGLGTMA